MVRKEYYFMTVLGAALALAMAFVPDSGKNIERTPEQLLADINYDTRFWSTDRVAQMIIQEDPLLMVVDVRKPEEYNSYHLPGAINVPLKNILDKNQIELFDQDINEIVLYSNGTIYANQAWMLLRRMNFSNLNVMQGGLNHWVETIMRPPLPPHGASTSEHELYQLRKGASMFFGGGSLSGKQQKTFAPIPTIKKRKKKAVEGGC